MMLPLLLLLAGDVDLEIAPVQQATPVWCWVAVGEMVFRKFDVPPVNMHYQCGVIGAMSLASNSEQCAQDCRLCSFPAANASVLMGMLIDYPRRASILTGQKSPRLYVTHADALSSAELKKELEAGRPVIAGINPNGRPSQFQASAHVAVIGGYVEREGTLYLIVNDPFPFSPQTWPDPYLANGAQLVSPGRYAIAYSTYINRMGWVESFLIRRDGQHQVAAKQCFASTPLQQYRCPASTLAKAGDVCACSGFAGIVVEP